MKHLIRLSIAYTLAGFIAAGAAPAAKACLVTSVTTGINATYGPNNATWVQFVCTNGNWFGAWAVYSSDAAVDLVYQQASNSMALGWRADTDGQAFDWNTTSVTTDQ